MWATEDITITAVKWLTFEESPGDHRACVFEFTTLSAISDHEKKIVYPGCRRLTSKCPKSVENYSAELIKQFEIHRVEQRLDKLMEDMTPATVYPADTSHPADILDRQV